MSTYVVYLTIYRGNRLPPFYIGYTRENKIEDGYRGSVKSRRYKDLWKKELRENPHLFKTVILQRFDTYQEALFREESLHRKLKVVSNPLYTNMSIGKGKFGFWGDDHPLKGKHPTEKTREKMRHSRKGRTPNKGKSMPEHVKDSLLRANTGRHPTDATIQKIRASHTGIHFSEERKKNISASKKGRATKRHIPRAKIRCPHCNKSGDISLMKRWHFENCHFFLKDIPPSIECA